VGDPCGEDVTVGSTADRREPAQGPPRRLPAGLPPAAGAAVMSTGILSTATQIAGLPALSWGLLVLALLAELALGAAVLSRLLTDRSGWLTDARTPASLTGVAATAVIGGRLASRGWRPGAWALLGVSTLLWLVLLPWVLRHWRTPTVGASFLVCVATEGLAVLAGLLAPSGPRAAGAGLTAFALGALLLGGVLYGVVVARFVWRQLAVGAGDHWVLAGALAITSLAAAEVVPALDRLRPFRSLLPALRVLDLAAWALATLGYAVLVGCELRWPRWRYDIRRWATVFPLGMAAAASFAVARVERLPALTVLGHVLLWPALAAWALAGVGAVRRRTGR
jgi:tellurite resistance protein TehA-like permease